jgi:fatty-acyl-CoA synthase
MACIIAVEGSTPTLDDVKEFCAGKIAHFKVPAHIRIVDDFPMTVTGKVRKVEMREDAIAALGSAASS